MSSLLLTLLSLAFLPQQNALKAGEAILDRVQAAYGAPEARAASQNLRFRGVASWEGLDGTGTFVETLGGSRRARLVTTFPGFGEFSRGSDGKLVWEQAPGRVEIKQGWDASADLRRIAILQLENWRTSYAAARLAGEETVKGRPCHRLELIPRALVEVPSNVTPKPDIWFVDAETDLPLRIDIQAGAVLEGRLYLSDWREVGGVRYPHRRRVEVNGFVLVLEYSEIERDVPLEASFFDPAQEVLVAAASAPLEVEETPEPQPEITVETLEKVHTAAIRVQCKSAELQKTFSVILPESHRYVVSAGVVESVGHVFARFHTMGEDVDLEAGVIVHEPIEGSGRVKPSTLPEGLTAVTWHVGPYHTLLETHARVTAWMAEEGYEVNGAPWEEYWTDPGMEPDSSKWRTRVLQPVRKTAE